MSPMDGYCLMCGKPIEGKRSTKKFCSASCRAQYSALPSRIESAAYYVQHYIAELEGYIQEHPEFTEKARPMFDAISDRLAKARPRKPYVRKEKPS